LPDSRGLDTIHRLLRAAPQIPVLVLSVHQDQDIASWHSNYLLDAHVLPKALPGMLERAVNDGAPFEGERGQVTLDSIGDAVMSTDVTGKITYLNPAAERMTGWSRELAAGRAVEDVYRIIEGTTREALHSPTALRSRKRGP